MPALVFLDLTPSMVFRLEDGYKIEGGVISGKLVHGGSVLIKSWVYCQDYEEDDL